MANRACPARRKCRLHAAVRIPMKRYSSTLPKVLLSGFDPFAGEAINPSWEAVRQLDDTEIAGHRLTTVQLPTRFGASITALKRALARTKPILVLCVGQAG